MRARPFFILSDDELLLFLAALNPFTLCVINATGAAAAIAIATATAPTALLMDFPSPRIFWILESCHMVQVGTLKPWWCVVHGKERKKNEENWTHFVLLALWFGILHRKSVLKTNKSDLLAACQISYPPISRTDRSYSLAANRGRLHLWAERRLFFCYDEVFRFTMRLDLLCASECIWVDQNWPQKLWWIAGC